MGTSGACGDAIEEGQGSRRLPMHSTAIVCSCGAVSAEYDSDGEQVEVDDDGPIALQLVTDKKKGKRKVDGIEIEPALVNASAGPSAPSLRKSTLIKGNAHGSSFSLFTRFHH